MQALKQWLSVATRGLCESAAERVRAEIGEHIASALESAGNDDLDPLEVEGWAVAALGNAETANRQYRRVLLTEGEEGLLRGLTSWWRSWGWLLGIPLLVLSVALRTLPVGYFWAMVLIEGMLQKIPVRSIRSGRIVRICRWGVLAVGVTILQVGYVEIGMWIGGTPMTVLIAVSILHTEYKLSVLRRKVPVGQWPTRLWV